MRTYLIQLLIGSCLVQFGQAQMDSIVWPLPIVKVMEVHPPAMHYELLENSDDEAHLTPLFFSTADLLEFKSAAYLRDYGNQTLSTLSIRGGSSQQTEILWNGARITNPMLGLGDVSMIPLPLFSDIHLQSLQQSGVYNPIGGALSLKNTTEDSSYYALGVSGGQFGHFKGLGKLHLNLNDKLKAKLQIFTHSDRQDFPYQEEHTSVLLPERQPHASFTQQGAIGQLSYQINKHHNLHSHLWLQGSEREIPPLITQSRSEAIQHDSFYRAQVELESNWNKYQHKIRVTRREESNIYSDPFNGIQNSNEFSSLQLQSEHQYQPTQYWMLRYGLSYENIMARTGNYREEASTDHWLGFLNPIYSIPGTPLQLDLAIRYNQQNTNIAPPGGHAAVKWIRPNQTITLSFQQATRFPSLNDLYWRPGGNLSLQPEFSQQLNLSYTFERKWDSFKYSQQLNAFFKEVDNWILWAPTEQFIWKPDNLLEVTSAGLEYSTHMIYSFSKKQQISFEGNALYQSVKSTAGPSTPLAQSGENLIYMPTSKVNGSLTYQFGPFELSYLHHYRSRIFTRPNLTESLEPLQLGQLRLSYRDKFLSQEVQLYAQAYNLWDQTYYFQPNRPAPGRHWRVGLLIQNR